MDPQTVLCHNMTCPARGQIGKGIIGVHSHKERRYICHVCNTTFSERKGTVFYRLRMSKDLVVLVVTLLAHGCPVQAIVAAFGLDERTLLSWATAEKIEPWKTVSMGAKLGRGTRNLNGHQEPQPSQRGHPPRWPGSPPDAHPKA